MRCDINKKKIIKSTGSETGLNFFHLYTKLKILYTPLPPTPSKNIK